MFSQFRNAVEHLAVQPMRRSTSQDSDTSSIMSRTNSSEGGVTSPTQLADSALSSIRRSLQAQRPSSPARPGTNGTVNPGAYDPNKPRSRLEERLRASLSFGIGELSNPSTGVPTSATNTPISTTAPTPLPGTETAPLSPTRTPLPDSPIGSPTAENGTGGLSSLLNLGDPLSATSALFSAGSSSHPLSPIVESQSRPGPPVITLHTLKDKVPLTQPTPVHHRSNSADGSLVEKLERVVELEDDDEEFQGRRYAEAQMPLPPTPPPESTKLPEVDPLTSNLEPPATTDPSQNTPGTEADPTTSSTNNTDGDAAGTDVEALRQQLKRFKERFTGNETVDID